MKVYFVRHGESKGNFKKTHQGKEEPLSKRGKKQVRSIAKRVKHLEIDVVYASPYLRTKQTAIEIAKVLKLPIEYWDEIRERKRPSEIEGLKLGDPTALRIDKITRTNQTKANWNYSDDESFNELVKRAKIVEKHLLKYHRNQNVLCVSHGGIMKMIVLHIVLQDKLTPEVFWQFYYHSWTDNTGITHLEYTDKYGWGLLGWNDTTHL